ncbi:probable transcription factor KAN2 isoform X5 [Cornus florida]|uniref:probable transcription factor KAN2 isoform X5 n=1 Tax=Cornus florida TaxID=4283 RepID=UPI0028965CC7|nr:probable transcription factor KAN2 isoform X5 [Cornus florida]
MKVDRGSASSPVSRLPLGQSDVFDNGSSGDNSEDLMFDIENPKRSELSIQHPRSNVHQDNDSHGLLIEQPFKVAQLSLSFVI